MPDLRGRVTSGLWDNSLAMRYFPEDREAGFVLLSTARARSDLTIRTNEKEAMRCHRAGRKRAQARPVPVLGASAATAGGNWCLSLFPLE